MTAKGIGVSFESIRQDPISGRYRVHREIGRGGMATVYLCTDIKTDQRVALKILRPELGSAVVVDRFLREIAFASELEHPQIPKVLDSGVIAELPYYVMSFIEGESLRARLDRVKQMTIDEAVRIMREVIKPTGFAHARGIIHRDIKPANILLSGNDVYVLDFGVARAIMASADESLTSTGVAVGTPAYMSPEQALAEHALDARSDIYSLGCVAYEMIAGIPPFVGATAQSVMARRFVSPPPPLSEVREMVPENVEEAIAKALCRAPADRWQTAEDFGKGLAGEIATPSVTTAAVRLKNRRRKVATLTSGAALTLIAATAVGSWAVVNREYVAKGRAALDNWNLAATENSLRKAYDKNNDDASARLWLGQLLILNRAPISDWAPLVLKAADSRSSLSPADAQRAEALAAYSNDESNTRCDKLRTLAAKPDPEHPGDFTAAVTLADCLVADPSVVPDRSSPSGFRFVSSFQQAANLYQGVLDRAGNNGAAFKAILPRLELVMWTTPTRLRGGVMHAATDQGFVASPELAGDTIAFIPYPLSGTGAVFRANAGRMSALLDRNLERLRTLASRWAKVSPGDPDAQEMLAGLLESTAKLEGPGGSAITSIRLARAAVASDALSDPSTFYQMIRLANSNVRLLVKLGRYAEARAIADSVIGLRPTVTLPDSLQLVTDALRTGLCGLTGRMRAMIEIEAKYSADYKVRLPSGETKKLPAVLGTDVLRFSAFSAFGAPRDSIMAVYRTINENLDAFVPSPDVPAFRGAILRRPLTLVLGIVGTHPLASLGTNADPLVKAVIALDKGDKARAKQLADSLTAYRAGAAPGSLTMDVVLQEAWLRSALGDSVMAARTLDRALRGLSRAPVNLLREAILAAGLVRAMRMRAELATAAGDNETAQKWMSAVRELWSNADPELKPPGISVQ